MTKVHLESLSVKASATYVHNSASAIHVNDTFVGYTVAQIVKAIRNAGLLA
jgi:hypothetical protein